MVMLSGSFSLPIGLDLGGGDEESAMHQSNIDLAPLRCAWAAMPEVGTTRQRGRSSGASGDGGWWWDGCRW